MGPIRVDICMASRLTQPFVQEWGDLCEIGTITHPFCRPEFIISLAEAENRLEDLRIITVRVDNVLKGVLPLRYHQKRLYGMIPVTILESGGGEFTDRFDVILESDSVRQLIIETLWGSLQRERWDMLVFNDIVEGGPLEKLIHKARVDKCKVGQLLMKNVPYRKLSAQENLQANDIKPISKNMRQQIGRCERNLSKTGKLELFSFEENDRELWEQFLQMEDAGWKGKAGTSVLRSPSEQIFIEKALVAGSNRKCLIWHVLKLDGKLIAMQFAFIWKQRYFLQKISYDEKYSSYKPGQLLTNAVFRDIAARGLIEYDFLGKEEEWKLSWTHTVRRHLSWRIYRPGVLMSVLCELQNVIVPKAKRFANNVQRGVRFGKGRRIG